MHIPYKKYVKHCINIIYLSLYLAKQILSTKFLILMQD